MDKELIDKIRQLVLEGKKNREILGILSLENNPSNNQFIYAMRNDLKKKGELSGSPVQRSTAVTTRKKNTSEFQNAVAAEVHRLKKKIDKCNTLLGMYEDTKVEFAVYLDKQITASQKKLSVLEELTTL